MITLQSWTTTCLYESKGGHAQLCYTLQTVVHRFQRRARAQVEIGPSSARRLPLGPGVTDM